MSVFDAKARQWESNPEHRARTEAIARAMRQRIPLSRTMKALEVGAGTGLLSFALREEVGPIVLTDTSEGMLAVLREKIAAAGIESMEPRLLDLAVQVPDERFDLLYLQMALHHIPDVEGILAVFHRLLTPGGHLAIADLDREDGAFHGEGFGGHRGFDRAGLGAQVERAGFHGVQFETVFQVRKEVAGGPRDFPVFLLTARRS